MRSLLRFLLVAINLGALASGALTAAADSAPLPASLGAEEASPPVTPDSPSDRWAAGGEDRPYWRRNLFRRVFSDQKYMVTTWWPSEFKRAQFAGPVAAATLAGILSQRDGENGADFTLGASVDHRSATAGNRIAGDFTQLGNGTTVAFLLGATYLAARRTGHDRLAEASSLSAESLLDAGIWIEVLKSSFARVRPNGANDSGRFFQYGNPDHGSFPSGHAMGAFAVATVFAEQYRDKRWMPWVAYGTASAIALSRVALGRHFPTDVLVGGILGNSIGRMVTSRQGETDRPDRFLGHLSPLYDPASQGYGVAYSKSW